MYFNPRPPRGGRHNTEAVKLLLKEFQSTPSARRATRLTSRHNPDLHSTGDEQIFAALGLGVVVAAGVVQLPFGGAQIFRPLLLQVNQCPLTAAEGKVLDAGHQQVVVRRVHQLNLSQVTPSGRVSATVTV